jgi:hypothetical protein
MAKPTKKKLFVIKKYIMATSAHEALKLERRVRPDDVWVDDDWKKENKYNLESSIGYHVEHDYYSSDEWAKITKHERETY